MALGKTNTFDGKSYSLKLKLKDGDTFLDCAEFHVQEKNPTTGKYETVQKIKDVDGNLTGIDVREGEFEGQPVRSFKLKLVDESKGEAYYVDVGLGSGLGRGLANSILNLKALDNVAIGLYGQKNKESGKTYPAVSVRQGKGAKETVKWAFDPKAPNSEFPPVREFKGKGGKIEKDYTDQELFLVAQLKAFAAKLEKNAPAAAPAENPAPKAPSGAKPAPGDLDDSVPF